MIQLSTKIQVKNRTAYRLYSNESGWSNIYYSLTSDALFPLLTDEVVPLSSGEVRVKLDTPDTTGMYVLSSIGDPIKTSLTIPVMDLTQNKNFYIFGTVHTSENTYVDTRIQCKYNDSNNTLIISIVDRPFYNTTYKMYKVFRT